MLIELLSFEDCPNRDVALARTNAALGAERMTAEITHVLVPDAGTARALRFLGSPTIRVDGLDVEPTAHAAEQFGLMCRVYVNDREREGAPSQEMIRAALRGRRVARTS